MYRQIFYHYDKCSNDDIITHKPTWQRWFDVFDLLESNNIDYELVAPKKWQHDFSLSKVKKERKQELKKIAKCFYEKVTLYTSDAICMAVWARANGQ